MSSYLCAGKQRQSQRPPFYRGSYRRRQEGGGPSGAIYGSAGIPPRDRATHLYSPHVQLIPKESWWSGGRGEGREEGVSAVAMWAKVIVVVIASEWRIWISLHNPFFMSHMYMWMNTCSHKHIYMWKGFVQNITGTLRLLNIKMAGGDSFWHISCAMKMYEEVSLHVWCQDVLYNMQESQFECVCVSIMKFEKMQPNTAVRSCCLSASSHLSTSGHPSFSTSNHRFQIKCHSEATFPVKDEDRQTHTYTHTLSPINFSLIRVRKEQWTHTLVSSLRSHLFCSVLCLCPLCLRPSNFPRILCQPPAPCQPPPLFSDLPPAKVR